MDVTPQEHDYREQVELILPPLSISNIPVRKRKENISGRGAIRGSMIMNAANIAILLMDKGIPYIR
jgi:hypothetical protein